MSRRIASRRLNWSRFSSQRSASSWLWAKSDMASSIKVSASMVLAFGSSTSSLPSGSPLYGRAVDSLLLLPPPASRRALSRALMASIASSSLASSSKFSIRRALCRRTAAQLRLTGVPSCLWVSSSCSMESSSRQIHGGATSLSILSSMSYTASIRSSMISGDSFLSASCERVSNWSTARRKPARLLVALPSPALAP